MQNKMESNMLVNGIESIANDLIKQLELINDIDLKVSLLNTIRKKLHEVSPMKNHPVDCVVWVKSDCVEKNDYNPNYVAPPEFKSLMLSISQDGYTMPVVTSDGGDVIEIVDGFHRRKSLLQSAEISKSTYGYLPITFIRKDRQGRSNRMVSTILHNRARGQHSTEKMVEIVSELKEAGMSDAWIMKQLGMDADELLRLKQISGLAALFSDSDFSMARPESEDADVIDLELDDF